ncbi:pectinesterase inhibitor 12-like [Triticum dicoccoides]|uniref:pectinesterase inhibitor 12-like n=1 Tax=Triticum dicoccoides TaxID=85692 RepID=UPI00189049BD|nr:pectinesterase inhibitor 12-like [Triticum dicoccoides]
MAMRPQVALLLALILLAAGDGSLAARTPSAIIRKTCAALDQPGSSVDYDYCVGALSADPTGASAKDARQLAVVATNLTVANITSTVLVLEDLVNSLSDCLRIYREMNRPLEAALGDLRAGHVGAANEKLSHVFGEPEHYDMLLFAGSAHKNPIRNGNVNAHTCGRSPLRPHASIAVEWLVAIIKVMMTISWIHLNKKKRIRNRASQERLTVLIDKFTNDQKGAAAEMGMQVLMDVWCTNLVNPGEEDYYARGQAYQ